MTAISLSQFNAVHKRQLFQDLLNVLVDLVGSKFVIGGSEYQAERHALLSCPDYKKDAPVIVECESYERSVKAARSIATEGDIVLLSPASASFDCFANFMERGDLYKKWVNELS